MRVLTLCQPWAQLIALGHKRVETRGVPTKYRGLVAIHAGKQLSKHVMGTSVGGLRGLEEVCLRDPFYEALQRRRTAPMVSGADGFTGGHTVVARDGTRTWVRSVYPLHVPLGAIVALARLTDCVPTERIWFEEQPGWPGPTPAVVKNPFGGWLAEHAEQFWGDYSRGRFGWMLSDVHPLKQAVPYSNGQGLRRLREEQVTEAELLALPVESVEPVGRPLTHAFKAR